jgi:hypothetical protein
MAETTRTDVGDGVHAVQLLTCGHRAVVVSEFSHQYPFAFCDRCQDVRNFASRKGHAAPLQIGA